MKIAYLLNQYPKASHSFIRREIRSLENLGFGIVRYAIRVDETEIVDVEDKTEFEKTRYLLNHSVWRFLQSTIYQAVRRPSKFLGALSMAIRIGWGSDRGLVRHLIYLCEASVLERLLRKDGVLHLHAHFGNNSAAVALLARLLGGPPYSFTIHGPIEFDKPEFMSLDKKIDHSEFVAAISSFGRSQLMRWIPYEHWEKVKVVHCGLEKSFHDIDVPPARQNRKLVCVGRLCEQKGQLLLVEAAANLQEEGEEFKLVLVGDGPMRKDIEALIHKHQLASRVSITGWVDNKRVREELIGCTAMILPSFAEGLPVVIMEAMAVRRPVITTYIAGIPELVIHGENGWLVPAGSTGALVTTMREVLNAPETLIQEMGDNARSRVLQRHNIETETKKLSHWFENTGARQHQ